MLGYKELEDIANLKRLSLENAEKDYLQDLLLFSIYSVVGKNLVFKGGTCLYKIYKLNRFSEDLDFTLNGKLDVEKLSNKMVSNLSLLNIRAKIIDTKKYPKEINIKLLLTGPLYKGRREAQCFIPLNISKREQVTLEPNKESIISLYKEVPNFELFVMQEKEVLAEKVRAVLTRTKARDVYDLWFLLKKKVGFDISLINKKLSIYKLEFNTNEFKKRIETMKGLWQTDLKKLIIGELPDFDAVKKEIFSHIASSS